MTEPTLPNSRNLLYDHIDRQLGQHIANLQEFVRQPSISNTGEGMPECAAFLVQKLKTLGCQRVELAPTSGYPVVYGELDAGQPHTLVIYSMYDVQPADEPGWTVPPFEGRLVERPPYKRLLLGRGARNTKGPMMAFLNVVETFRAVYGQPLVNLLFVLEGEEEQGSRHLPEFLTAYHDRLKKAEAVYFPHALQTDEGNALVFLGTKGLVYFELECSGANWGKGPKKDAVHSSYKAYMDSPVWRLVQALSTMTSPDGNTITIDGFYDKMKPPTPADEELMAKMVGRFNPDHVGYGVDNYLDNLQGLDLIRKVFFSTSLNIDGIWAGYTGPGSKTLLPHKATAKMDIRLVPDQTPGEMLELVRRHLDARGYNDIQINVLGRVAPAKVGVEQKLPQAILRAYRKFGVEPQAWPMNPGTMPFSMFSQPPLGLPVCVGGIGRSGRSHAPDEFLVIEGNDKVFGLADYEKSMAAILCEYASQ